MGYQLLLENHLLGLHRCITEALKVSSSSSALDLSLALHIYSFSWRSETILGRLQLELRGILGTSLISVLGKL